MKMIVMMLGVGLALADPSPLKDISDGTQTPIHYRPFHKDMVGPASSGGRDFEEQDPNWSKDSYTGPHQQGWNEEASKASYWSYDHEAGAVGTGGMKPHNHHRNPANVDENGQWDSKRAESEDESDLWDAYMKKEKFFSLDHQGKKTVKDIDGGSEEHRLTNLDSHAGTYMMPKDHFQFFSTAADVCNPEPVTRGKKQVNIIAGLRSRHNSGHTYQGCSLDNCAMTVMYACSFMCTTCQAKWCRDECQGKKEKLGSCYKIWDDISANKCKNGFETVMDDTVAEDKKVYVLNEDAPVA